MLSTHSKDDEKVKKLPKDIEEKCRDYAQRLRKAHPTWKIERIMKTVAKRYKIRLQA